MDGLEAQGANLGGYGRSGTYKTYKTGFCRFCRCHPWGISQDRGGTGPRGTGTGVLRFEPGRRTNYGTRGRRHHRRVERFGRAGSPCGASHLRIGWVTRALPGWDWNPYAVQGAAGGRRTRSNDRACRNGTATSGPVEGPRLDAERDGLGLEGYHLGRVEGGGGEPAFPRARRHRATGAHHGNNSPPW